MWFPQSTIPSFSAGAIGYQQSYHERPLHPEASRTMINVNISSNPSIIDK